MYVYVLIVCNGYYCWSFVVFAVILALKIQKNYSAGIPGITDWSCWNNDNKDDHMDHDNDDDAGDETLMWCVAVDTQSFSANKQMDNNCQCYTYDLNSQQNNRSALQ